MDGDTLVIETTERRRLLEHLSRMAPGTQLRDGFERILRGRTGALVVLGDNPEVQELSTGGFPLDVPYSATALRELAKMDGAIIVDPAKNRIAGAGIHLTPDPRIDTVETGTRHRTADRVSRQTGLPVISVSASMATITLYLDQQRHLLEHSDQILTRANQALQTLERYRARLWEVTHRLSALEVQDQVTVKDFVLVVQRLEMVRRLDLEIRGYGVELGSNGRLVTLQRDEMSTGVSELRELLEQDYRPAGEAGDFGFDRLETLDTAALVEPLTVARAIGLRQSEDLDSPLSTRGYRQVAQINRLPASFAGRLIEHFGSLQALFSATSAELMEVEGVGESRARSIRDGLLRLAESAYTERD